MMHHCDYNLLSSYLYANKSIVGFITLFFKITAQNKH